jgi:Flp pilus assembly protein CpaB
MEMEIRDDSRRHRLVMVLGLVLALAAGGGAFYLLNQGSAVAEPLPTRSVLVAAVEIPPRTVIESGFLTMRDVPDDPSVANAITDPAAVLGLVTGVRVYAGQVMTRNLLATSSAGAAFSVVSPSEVLGPNDPNWRAASVRVEKERAVGGEIRPGQRVDVITTLQVNVLTEQDDGSLGNSPSKDGYYSDKTTKIVFSDIEVLAAVPDDDLYILKVDAHQGEEIAHIQASGSGGAFTLMLRSDGDARILDRDGYGETTDRLITQYGFALPRIINVDRYPQPEPEDVPLDPTPAPVVSPAPSAAASLAPGTSPSPGTAPGASPAPSTRP